MKKCFWIFFWVENAVDQSTPSGPNPLNGTTGWELALVTAPSSNESARAESKLVLYWSSVIFSKLFLTITFHLWKYWIVCYCHHFSIRLIIYLILNKKDSPPPPRTVGGFKTRKRKGKQLLLCVHVFNSKTWSIFGSRI